MTEPTPDTAFTIAEALLGRFLARLDASGCGPGKSFIADGASVPAEDCCDGIAWTRVGDIQPTSGDSNPYAEMRNLPAGPSGHDITIEVGIMRCTPILDEQGNPPPSVEYTEAAKLNASDRLAMRQAVLCDWPADLVAANCDGYIPSNWTPIEAGGCGGGYMTITVGTTLVF